MTLMMKARAFAEERHEGQTYDGGSYVRNHLDRVVEVLTRFGVTDPEMLAAGYLHDTLEDTVTSERELITKFGVYVANLVVLLTNDRDGVNRRHRQRRTYERMALHEPAVTVKLADRIANVESSLCAEGKSYFGMYRKEYDFFRSMLHSKGRGYTVHGMWEHLDRLIQAEWTVTV